MKKIVMYTRVSTNDQSTESQELAIRKYCEHNGWNVHKIYSDHGISGAKDSRPQLDQLKKDVIKGKIDCLVVFKFDRIARSTSHLLECLKLFQKHEVDFVSVTEGIDTSTPIGQMVFTLISAISEFERSIISQRVKAGIAKAKDSNTPLGRPRKAFDVQKAIQLRQDGQSYRQIAEVLNVSKSQIQRQLKDCPINPMKSDATDKH